MMISQSKAPNKEYIYAYIYTHRIVHTFAHFPHDSPHWDASREVQRWLSDAKQRGVQLDAGFYTTIISRSADLRRCCAGFEREIRMWF